MDKQNVVYTVYPLPHAHAHTHTHSLKYYLATKRTDLMKPAMYIMVEIQKLCYIKEVTCKRLRSL